MERRAPDLTGVAKAWRVNLTEEAAATHRREYGYDHTGVDSWFINGPYHPLWSWWHVAAISLRDIPGIPNAHKQYPEAEYELTIYSLDSKNGPNIEALEAGRLDEKDYTFLLPADVTFHCDGLTDEQVRDLTKIVVEAIVLGRSCDSDARSWWLSTLTATVEDIKREATS